MRKTIGELLRLGTPLAIGFVSQMAISFTDAALVSRLGPVELAGTTLALSLFSLVMLFGLGVITSVSAKAAESYRQQDIGLVRTWYGQGAWISLFVGALGVIILLNTGLILRAIGQDVNVAAAAQDYNNGAAFGLVFFFLYVNVRSLMSAVGRPKPLTWIMLAAIPVNFGVGYLLIFGLGGANGMGVLGAGLSSSVVRAAIIIAAIATLVRARMFRDLGISVRIVRFDLRRFKDLLRLGLPIGMRILVAEGFLPVVAFLTAQFGANSTAAHTVGLRIETLATVLALGFSAASTTLAAWALADRDWRALRRLRRAILIVAGSYGAIVCAIIWSAFGFIQDVVFPVNDPGVAEILWALLPLLLATILLDPLGTMFNGLLVGVQDTVIPTLVVTISYWGVGLGVGAILAWAMSMGLLGLWLGMVLAAGAIALFNYLRAGWHIRKLRDDNARASGVQVDTSA